MAGGLVTVDLNTGDVANYGAEVEVIAKSVLEWTITEGLGLLHARLTCQLDWKVSLFGDRRRYGIRASLRF